MVVKCGFNFLNCFLIISVFFKMFCNLCFMYIFVSNKFVNYDIEFDVLLLIFYFYFLYFELCIGFFFVGNISFF